MIKQSSLYEKDFYAWTVKNAELLRHKKFDDLDVENIAEEIESMGRSEKRELLTRLSLLLSHLLKWQYQSSMRTNSWKLTIKEQRRQIKELLEESPSLKNKIEKDFNKAYRNAVIMASRETGIIEYDFPSTSLYNLQECLDVDYFLEN